MDHDSEEFTPIIAAGIEYSGVSTYRTPSPRTPHHAPSHLPLASPLLSRKKSLPPAVTPKRLTPIANGLTKATPENGRTPSTHVKKMTTPSPWRASPGGIPVAPVKYRNGTIGGIDTSTPSPWRSVSTRVDSSGPSGGAAPVKQQSMSVEYRLSNDHSHSQMEDSSSHAAVKSAPIRHLSFSRCSFKQVSLDIRRLRQLARQGSWKLLIERVKDAQRRGLLASPDQEIAFGTYHLLALMKLQDFRAAAMEIAAFGDLDAPQYRFENHPDLYPEKSGSMVPFALRCMHAELPHRVGKTAETLHRLYNLLAHCDSQIDALQAERSLDATEGSSSSSSFSSSSSLITSSTTTTTETRSEDDSSSIAEDPDIAILKGLLSTWQKRREAVCFSTVSYHLHQQQYVVALQWLDKLVASSPCDPHLKTKAGLIQLQLGDAVGAQRTFSDVEALVASTKEKEDFEMKNLLARNRGILCVALGEFPKAIAEFDAVLARDPNDIVSANNKALCLLYNQQLLDATDVLEDAIFRGPKWMLNEAVIANVCSMYEVVSFSGAAAKRSLRTWMKDQGPDDFEPTSFRL